MPFFSIHKGYIRGDNYIIMGKYPQGPNGEIKELFWDILEEKDGKALIITQKIIDSRRFDENSNNYANSEIREWLNNTFYNETFTPTEKLIIITTNVDNSAASTGFNPNRYVCEDTEDRVFLLSYSEVIRYFSDDTARQAEGTDYAEPHGLWIFFEENGKSPWWLRSPSDNYFSYVSIINFDGSIIDFSRSISNIGVRPAMWIKL